MAWRKCLVRGLVFSALGGIVLAGLLYQAWTNPEATRRQVLDQLGTRFPGAVVSVESARLRLLGGIAVHELRMTRRDDLDRADFLYVPSAVFHHDKEHLLAGRLGILKVELSRPRLRVVRERDGRWNLSGLLGPLTGERMPTIVVQQGTLLLEDRSAAPGTPLLEIKDVTLTAVNDPAPVVTVEAAGQTDIAGAVRIQARVQRATGEVSARVELPSVPVGPALVQRLAGPCPDLARHLRQLTGTAAVEAILGRRPGDPRPLGYDVTCHLHDGRYSHARLPLPLEQIEAELHCIDGDVPHAHLTARSGPTRLELTLRDLTLPAEVPHCLEDLVRELDARVEHLPVTDSLFGYLPDYCEKEIKDPYAPAGPVSFTYAFRRTGTGRWRKHWSVRPEGMGTTYAGFKYRVERVTGTLEIERTSEKYHQVMVDLAGYAGDRPVTLRGTVEGVPGDSTVDLTLEGRDIPLDGKLYNALPEGSQKIALQFLPQESRELGLDARPMGKGDFQVFIRRGRGQREPANRFVVRFHDASVQYDLFPYQLEDVSGVLDIRPDHWECRDFRGTHRDFRGTRQGGEIRVAARSYRLPPADGRPAAGGESATPPPPAGPAEKRDRVRVEIQGRDLLLDDAFVDALAPRGLAERTPLQKTWKTLALQGHLSFSAVVVDRPDQPQDIDVTVNVRDCTMQPAFFPYALNRVGARVRYAHGRVELADARAVHGRAVLGMKSGLILLTPGGGFQGWFTGITGADLVPDADLLRALPEALRGGVAFLNLRQPLDVKTNLVLVAPDAGPLVKVWWDGKADLRRATLQAGVELSGVSGQLACSGYFNGQRLQGLQGGFLLQEATLLGQPFHNLHGRLVVDPKVPEALHMYDLGAQVFGGYVGGEALLRLGANPAYEASLHALQIQLEKFGRHNNLGADVQLQGATEIDLYLRGEGTDLSGLRGEGQVKVPEGKMYRLPLLLDLLKAFGFRLPDRTAFEQAEMQFAIAGPQVRVEKVSLIGNAISLRGQGTVNLDGSNVNLDFHADWSRFPQVLPEEVLAVPRAVSDQILKVKMRGQIGKGGKVKFEPELFPAIKKIIPGTGP